MALIEGIYCISMLYSNFDIDKLKDAKTDTHITMNYYHTMDLTLTAYFP